MEYIVSDYENTLKKFYSIVLEERGLVWESDTTYKEILDLDIKQISVDYNESKIVRYLQEQSIEHLRVIQAVVYIGEDYSNDLTGMTRDEILNTFIKEFSSMEGNDDNEVIIIELYDKAQLGKYLKDGLEKLNVNV